MDQIDNNLSTDIRQNINNDISVQYSLNYVDQFFQQNNSISNIEHEQDENDQISMPIIYKKRVRTKFSQEQLDVLEASFQQHRYPSVDIIDDLVEQLNLPTQKITIWFQNRRARLKKSQQKFDIQSSFEKDDQQRYDSGIQLDEDVSHDSPASPPADPVLNLPPPPTSYMMSPHSYYLPSSHYSFYNSMWPNFGYSLPTSSFQSPIVNTSDVPYNLMNYHSSEIPSSFIFQDMSNYQNQKEFNGEI